MPPHLAHALPERQPEAASHGLKAKMQGLRLRIDGAVTWMIEAVYGPVLRWGRDLSRLIVAAAALAILMIALGVVGGGHVNFFLFPKTDAEFLLSQVTLPQGTPADRTLDIVSRIEKAAWQLNRAFANYGARSPW